MKVWGGEIARGDAEDWPRMGADATDLEAGGTEGSVGSKKIMSVESSPCTSDGVDRRLFDDWHAL